MILLAGLTVLSLAWNAGVFCVYSVLYNPQASKYAGITGYFVPLSYQMWTSLNWARWSKPALAFHCCLFRIVFNRIKMKLPGQGSGLQDSVSMPGPSSCSSHVFPRCFGSGLLHSRSFWRTPPPQVTVHSPKSPHGPYPPSTAKQNIGNVSMQFSSGQKCTNWSVQFTILNNNVGT